MKVLVCGGRTFNDRDRVFSVLDRLHHTTPITRVIHGGAPGADRLAGAWAALHTVPVSVFFAKWNDQGRGAGHIRNAKMLTEGQPDLVLCFPGGPGTAHMHRIAMAAGVLTLTAAPI